MPAASLSSLLRDLQAAFPRERISAETAALYARELSTVPLDVLEPTVREIIRTSGADAFFPRVGEILRVAAERTLGLPGEAEALAQVEARIAWGAERVGHRPAVHKLVAEALESVGGFAAYRTAEKPGIARAQFLALYREMRARTIREFTVGPVALDAGPERKALPTPEP